MSFKEQFVTEAKELVVGFNFEFDDDSREELTDELVDLGYKEGEDFEYAIGRGDDYANAITLTSKKILKDKNAKDAALNWECDEDEEECYS